VIILDTDVLSELMKREPVPGVEQWLTAQPPASLFTTSVAKAEVLYGVALLPSGERRDALEEAVAAMFEEDFDSRVLAFDGAAAYEYAIIASHRRHAGKPISQFDAQIAAIARSKGAAVATRNVSDFDDCGIDVHNPWGP
jgi:predicted nucleic acid-binding protein